tara:strand:- start:64 stop:258 length:195 start_codon:yes stop_codon:yes gene_type:complete
MSGEHFTTENIDKNHISSRITKGVDINKLRAKLREEKNKEKNGNYIFLGIVISAIAVTGVIASI